MHFKILPVFFKELKVRPHSLESLWLNFKSSDDVVPIITVSKYETCCSFSMQQYDHGLLLMTHSCLSIRELDFCTLDTLLPVLCMIEGAGLCC